jgi:5'(3')-deoxyribonucleotidase
MRIITDFDSCIGLSHECVRDLYRELTGDYSTEVDNTITWRMDSLCPLWTPNEIDAIFGHPRLFEFMKPIPNSIETLEKLHNEGHEIIIATVHRPDGILNKSKWIRKHLPFINTILFLDNNIKMDKSMIKGNIIIDDVPSNVINSICDYKILFGLYNWSMDIDISHDNTIYRAYDWESVYSIIQNIVKKDLK